MSKFSVTRWQPDTCGCVVHYRWDRTLPVEQRVHTAVPEGHDGVPSKRCALHQQDDWHEHFKAVLAHNRAAARIA